VRNIVTANKRAQHRFVVYGAGAIGSALGAWMHLQNYEVLLVGRRSHVQRIREAGLELRNPEGVRHVQIPAVIDLGESTPHPSDVILLCVKSQDTDTALREIRAAGTDLGRVPVFCLQNSIVNESAAQRFAARVYGVMLNVPGVFLEPGVVSNPITGNHGFMDIGRYPFGIDDLAVEVAHAISNAGYATHPHEAVMAAKAAKMIGNLGNAFGAITDGREDTTGFMKAVRAEGEAAFQAAGIVWEPRDAFEARVNASRGTTMLAPGERNLGSTWQSLMRGAPSLETDYLNGEIVRLGRIHGVPTPRNTVLQAVASKLHVSGGRPGAITVAELEAMAANLCS
jgi:2-dehydropantoate 2-reductase